MPRAVKEWIGKTPDSMPTNKVRQRIFDREKGICHICKGKIEGKKWDADHVPPLKDGGENRESMMKPAHSLCHRKLTAQQAIERAPVERQKMKHSGADRPASTLRGRPLPPGKNPRHERPMLPRRPLYVTWPRVAEDRGD